MSLNWIVASAKKGSPADEDDFLVEWTAEPRSRAAFTTKESSSSSGQKKSLSGPEKRQSLEKEERRSRSGEPVNDMNSEKRESKTSVEVNEVEHAVFDLAEEQAMLNEFANEEVEGMDQDEAEADEDLDFLETNRRPFSGSRFQIMMKNSEDTYEIQTRIEEMGGVIVQKSPEIVIMTSVYTTEPRDDCQLYTKYWVVSILFRKIIYFTTKNVTLCCVFLVGL